ncbi:MAG: SseB family protein [Bacteroidales bacterium]|nr:SseB family protein [Bacteroidales bacterium]MCM1416289.1 SseB family protein [bacterium]MCM1424351.1 SseB family protein [bacterium]
MAEQKIDNAKLEEAIDKFRADKEKDSYVNVMELLEQSIVFVPAMMPQELPAEIQKQMQAGKPVQLPKETKMTPCLLKKETGEQALPIFTSPAKIPADKKPPMVMAMPFMGCVSMVMANPEKVEEVVINPFTGMMILNKSILEVAEKRRKAAGQIRKVQMTKEQFRDFAHNRLSLSVLPKYLFTHKEEGVKRLQQEEGAFLLGLYDEIYPKGEKCGHRAEDFSLMTLNLTDNIQMTRLDLPDEAEKCGLCYRIYAVWKRDTEEVLYYTLEKTKDGNFIGRVTADGKHEIAAPAPDNGAEIEAIMNLL